jgi:DNA (cytosine-5)-methyltransferase 1
MKFELYLALDRLNMPSLLMRDGLSDAKEELRQEYRNQLNDVKYPILKTTGDVLATSAEQFWSELERHKTRKHSQRVLQIKAAAPTVITSPDDYIHPTEPRVLSVRELARFQGFPEAFTFRAKETTGGIKRAVEVPQYSQVGNAVSPYVGRALGALVRRILDLTASPVEG